MSVVFFLKNNLNKLPIGASLGKIIAKIPYSIRPGIGKQYTLSKREIVHFDSLKTEQKNQIIFNKIKAICDFAYSNTLFYKKYYDEAGFHPTKLKSYNDIRQIPITSKEIFQKFSLEERSSGMKGSKSNTGGSSGKPLTFYTSPEAIGHQWAHLHKAWGTIGYTQNDLKVIFAGRSNVREGVEYDLVRHSYSVDIYSDLKLISANLKIISAHNSIKFLHGYPSALYEFTAYCEENDVELLEMLKSSLKGIILNSEFPVPMFRKKIESTFNVPSLATYGHTERCILAYEKNTKNEYEVMQTYGFTEIIDNNLVGTSYYSFATPFIRYNTEDEVNSFSEQDNLLMSFSIKQGRKGEFVIDNKGKKISLTGLIYGRHHKLFDHCKYIQVYQKEKGKMTVFYTTTSEIFESKAAKLFDSNNIDMEFSFKRVKEPYKTPAGKVLLKLSQI